MQTSWTKPWTHFKSPLRVVVQFLGRSRNHQAQRRRKLTAQLQETQQLLLRRDRELEQQRQETRHWQQRARHLESEQRRALHAPPPLPPDPPVGKHGYGPRLISLAVNLAQSVGLRGTQRALQIFFDWLQVAQDIPHATTIRN